ncbi:MAG: hypothetical protein DME72_07515 [Verrucomicrobia bacterium]|nr:MAG: hypothetical protein DME72_07515 [Verrucomicrobiota bacterium]
MTTAIKERSTRNSESEMNGNRSVRLGSIAFPLFLASHAPLRFYWFRFWNQALTSSNKLFSTSLIHRSIGSFFGPLVSANNHFGCHWPTQVPQP